MLSRIWRLFPTRVKPLAVVTHPVLGEMRWSDDDDSWAGIYRGYHFLLSCEGQASPSESLANYAVEVMDDPGWLESTLAEAKEQEVGSFESYYTDEIRELSLGTLHFSNSRGQFYLLADLEPGRDFRCWRIEYSGRRCEGIGFDD